MDMDYPMNNIAGNADGRMTALTGDFATGRKMKKSRGARKNHLLLSNQRVKQRPTAQTSNAFYQPGSYSNNLNVLLDEMDKQDAQSSVDREGIKNPFNVATSQQIDTKVHNMLSNNN